MTARELRDAERAYQPAARRAEALRLERNRLVHEALDEGWSHRALADVLGMHHSRVGQVAQGRER
jgi:hypothetical protein